MTVGDTGRENNAFKYDGPPQYNQTNPPRNPPQYIQSNPNQQHLPGQYSQPYASQPQTYSQMYSQTRVPLYHTAPYTQPANGFTPGNHIQFSTIKMMR